MSATATNVHSRNVNRGLSLSTVLATLLAGPVTNKQIGTVGFNSLLVSAMA